MISEVYLHNKKDAFDAVAEYYGNKIIVKKGSRIRDRLVSKFKGGKAVKRYRQDMEYVSEDYILTKDCVFDSPSTAAKFVTGCNVNGYNAWKLENGMSLGDFLRKKSIRQ